MPEEHEDKKLTGWQMVGLFALRIIDSGLAPWALVALFLLGGFHIVLGRLDSKDTLTLIYKVGTLRGFAWAGWVVAFVEIAICKWVVNRTRKQRLSQVNELNDRSERAMDELVKMKQSQLEFKQEKPGQK